ncbi:M20/M25/M40 family metallo-hydrolase [Halocatena pleomorpha]|uniref:M20/M25/M40 family metallo-hydrolase n=1 Tax=Halocatena pleomorpha TaxID=1785090 RepID=A0A3P3RHG0_9EURY|nr:M20/M25/M40 family metallo-hydrolase [Halocatena pleomorpha]RRJ32956.1 M20/M25/M40 family metallo-hydrolase [Halocatena pleomorpha]
MAFDPLAFHERAVKTPSDESSDAMRELVVETLREQGAEPTIDGAGNTLAETSGAASGPHLVLNTHLDTVPPHVPFRRDGSIVYGRGACDAKGPLAALVAAFLATDPDRGRLTLALTPDEETTSAGAAALDLDGDGYIVGEPTGLDVCTAAKGRFEGTITIHGTNAHAADPAAGVNAVAAVEDVLSAIRSFDRQRGPDTHAMLGRPTLTPTVVRGGDAVNQIPDRCTITVDRRSVPPETAAGFEAALNDHLVEQTDADCEFSLTDRETPFLEAFATPEESDITAAVTAAGGGELRPFTAATEASYFAPAPTVVFGPGVLTDEEGAVAHADREYVRQPAIERAADIVQNALGSLLGSPS